jgi:2-polyprenyl-6-methoxyphenol hydroxylase-like FAD-dependent oxidoreductase
MLAQKQRLDYFWDVVRATGVARRDELDVLFSPSYFVQQPMHVPSVTDPVNASFFLVGDAAHATHAATAAGAQAAAIDGARVAHAWVMEQKGWSPKQAAAFYQRGTTAASRGLIRRGMLWFKKAPRPEELTPIPSVANFPKLDIPALWRNRKQLKGWQGNTIASFPKRVMAGR